MEYCNDDKYGATGGGEIDYDVEGQDERELREGVGQGEGDIRLGREN